MSGKGKGNAPHVGALQELVVCDFVDGRLVEPGPAGGAAPGLAVPEVAGVALACHTHTE